MTIIISLTVLSIMGILVAICPDTNYQPAQPAQPDQAFQAAQADYFADGRYWR